MNRKSWIQVLVILAVGAVLAVWILRPEWFQPAPLKTNAISKVPAKEKGSHGGRLFAQNDLTLEVVLFERGVPPEYRIYPYKKDGTSIPLDEIQVGIELNRLDRVDHVGFSPAEEYLLGDIEIVEPHSFEMKLSAQWSGKSFEWKRTHIEYRVDISQQQAKGAGIKTSVAGSALLQNVSRLNGEIGLDEKRVTHVVPRVDAMVTFVGKDLGDSVKRNDLLAVLESRELADAKIAYLDGLKRAEPVRLDFERQRLLYSNTLKMLDILDQGGSLDERYAEINKLALGESRSSIIPAFSRLVRAQSVHEREKSLYAKKISSKSEYLLAQEEFKSAEAKYLSLREKVVYEGNLGLLDKKRLHEMAQLNVQTNAQKLLALGLGRKEIDALPTLSPHLFTRYELRSQISGQVIQKHLAVGEAVKRDADVFILADLAEVWVNIAIPEADLKLVKIGQNIRVQSENIGLSATGKLFYLGSLIDPKTRSVTGRLVIPNANRKWRPGMYVTVDLIRKARPVPIGIPVTAIQTLRDWSVVFLNKGTFYEARPLELGQSDGETVEVVRGLNPGDRYVVSNSFAIKAEIEKSSATHDH